MDTLVRNATLRFSTRRDVNGYEPLNPKSDGDLSGRGVSFSGPKGLGDGGNGSRRMFSRPKSYRNNNEAAVKKDEYSTISYRRERARKRLIFLQSYKLETAGKSKTKKKLEKVVIKVKSLVVSVLSFIGTDSLRFCSSRSAISASLPTRVVKCF